MEGDIEGFPVCGLHDGQHTRALLEELKLPGHYWHRDRPMVLPVGDLEVAHFEPKEGDGIYAGDCAQLQEIDFDAVSFVLPKYDLCKEWQP